MRWGGLVEAQEAKTRVKGIMHLSIPIEHVVGNVDVVLEGERSSTVVELKKYKDGSLQAEVADTISVDAPLSEPRMKYEIIDINGNGSCDPEDIIFRIIEEIQTEKGEKPLSIQSTQKELVKDISDHLKLAYEAFAKRNSRQLSTDVQVNADHVEESMSVLSPNLNIEGSMVATVDGVKKTIHGALGSYQGYPTVGLSVNGSQSTYNYGGNGMIEQEVTTTSAWEFWDNDKDKILEPGERVWEVQTTNETNYKYDNRGNLTNVETSQRQMRLPATFRKDVPRNAAQNVYAGLNQKHQKKEEEREE